MFENKTNFYFPDGEEEGAAVAPEEPASATKKVEPRTRKEHYLAAIAGEDVTMPEPKKREEFYLAKIGGADISAPEPKTRKEYYLNEIAENGGGTKPTGSLSITANGVYDVTEYADAVVKVPNPSTGTLSITTNGTHDVKNYASAEVSVEQTITYGKINITNNSEVSLFVLGLECENGTLYRKSVTISAGSTGSINAPIYYGSEMVADEIQVTINSTSAGTFTGAAGTNCAVLKTQSSGNREISYLSISTTAASIANVTFAI